jgi:hypothetical protein
VILYHYTSQTGLIGICSSKELWATKIQYLNDHQEFKFGVRLVRAVLRSGACAGKGPYGARACAQAADYLNSIPDLNIFVGSLSANGDLLSQWRGYSKGAAGYSLGFGSERLESLAKANRFRLVECVYDPADQTRIVSELLDRYVQSFEREVTMDGMWYERCIGKFCERLSLEVVSLAPVLKNPAFKEEGEWRLISGLVYHPNDLCAIRPGPGFLIPYYRFPLVIGKDQLAFEELVIGPSTEPSLALDGVCHLLTIYNCPAKAVRASIIPYRSV